MAEPELLKPAEQRRWVELTAALPQLRGEQYPSVALATFGSHHAVVHRDRADRARCAAVMAALPGLLREAAADLGCRSSALLYVGEPHAADVGRFATDAGYQCALLGADAVHHPAGRSWSEHLAALPSRRRTRLRRELRNYSDEGFRTVVRTGPAALGDEVVALQVAHRSKHGLPGGEDRVRQDFARIGEEFEADCVVLGAERAGRLHGFVLYLRTAEALFGRTAGFAPNAAGCYFALAYHETTRFALEHGIREVHYGLASYEAKLARGCALDPRWGWFAFHHGGGGGGDAFREVLVLQSRSVERRLHGADAPAGAVPSWPATHSTDNPGAPR
jgi:predicted N-acyltransferase